MQYSCLYVVYWSDISRALQVSRSLEGSKQQPVKYMYLKIQPEELHSDSSCCDLQTAASAEQEICAETQQVIYVVF